MADLEWIKVNVDGKDCAFQKGIEVKLVYPPSLILKIQKGEMEILIDGIPSDPEVLLEKNCQVKIRAKAKC
ncbi:MAG TPA: hypothetical protein ENN28_04115 [Candidatus Uhrbacteria bacterium]|nr:hypothetical protein [Candidatus Uhrbacteria bacterium]